MENLLCGKDVANYIISKSKNKNNIIVDTHLANDTIVKEFVNTLHNRGYTSFVYSWEYIYFNIDKKLRDENIVTNNITWFLNSGCVHRRTLLIGEYTAFEFSIL